MTKKYIHRTIEKNILNRIQEFPILVLTGPRQTGKSTMLKNIFPNYNYTTLDDPLIRDQALKDPKLFLESFPSPLIIDEIQYVPELLPYLKIEVDRNRERNGQYILTGSQLFNLMQGISESLAGRAAIFELLGFSYEETMQDYPLPQSLEQCFNALYTGFYPETCIHHVDLNSFFSSYVQTYIERDIRQIRSVHDLRIFQQFLELLAARIGSLLNLNEISKECGISHTTASQWLSLLESTRIVYLLRPYHKNISKRVVKSPKIYFTDTGLLAYILKYPNPTTLQTGPIAGHIFENMMIIETLKNKFNTNKRFDLYFFRDTHHNEIDLVLDSGSTLTAIEYKLAKTLQPNHWKTLEKLQHVLPITQSYLLSFYEKEMGLTASINHKPWWELAKILNQTDL